MNVVDGRCVYLARQRANDTQKCEQGDCGAATRSLRYVEATRTRMWLCADHVWGNMTIARNGGC